MGKQERETKRRELDACIGYSLTSLNVLQGKSASIGSRKQAVVTTDDEEGARR
jgi:hypothetical protein